MLDIATFVIMGGADRGAKVVDWPYQPTIAEG
jgi:hypothetical protein